MFLKSLLQKAGSVISLCYTFSVVMISWAIFATDDIGRLGSTLKKMFFLGDGSGGFVIPFTGFYVILAIAIGFSFFTLIPAGKRLHNRVFNGKFSFRTQIPATALTLLLVVLCLSYITASKFNPFIYFRF